ncbi:hypothetical protein MKX03_027918 [Papaver bracteatum]|nr:hypothetical protein MKX03_027918 [Papaver bracteatum]
MERTWSQALRNLIPVTTHGLECDEMKEARGYATATVFGESIFVISGLKDGEVECYKEGQGWSVANLKGAGKR